MEEKIIVSVIVVAKNAEVYIEECIKSIVEQFVDEFPWELIIIDSLSTDQTHYKCNIILKTLKVNYKLLTNTNRTLSSGWNIGIKNASGTYVVRPDAHALLHKGYILKGIELLQKMEDVVAVGGVLETKANGFWGKIIKEALSSTIGVGNSSFRTGKSDRYADTVVYAVYRKEIFQKVGLFNERLVRHQDNDMHTRIKATGGKLYISKDMRATYYCRANIFELFSQMFSIGYHLPDVGIRTLQLRHLAPFSFFSFVAVLIVFPGLFRNISLIGFGLYLFIVLIDCLIRIFCFKNISFMLNMLIIPGMHFHYALGTLMGISFKIISKFKKINNTLM